MKHFNASVKALNLAIPMIFLATAAQAAGTGMPWEPSVDAVSGSIAGPVLKAAMTLLIVGAGITMARSSDAGTQKFAGLIFGGSIAGAVAYFLGFFNVGAGALI